MPRRAVRSGLLSAAGSAAAWRSRAACPVPSGASLVLATARELLAHRQLQASERERVAVLVERATPKNRLEVRTRVIAAQAAVLREVVVDGPGAATGVGDCRRRGASAGGDDRCEASSRARDRVGAQAPFG